MLVAAVTVMARVDAPVVLVSEGDRVVRRRCRREVTAGVRVLPVPTFLCVEGLASRSPCRPSEACPS